ncbi:MAG: HEAT repeat domain-containing protein, partial [Planctomycetota bacterium]
MLGRLHAILTLLLVSPAAGQQPVRLIGAAFGGVAGAAERAGPRNEALASVQAVDAPELVSALVSAWGVVHSEARAVERERGRAAEQKLPSVSEMRERVELDACFGQMTRIEALLAQAEGRARAELAEVVLGSRYPSQLRAILAPAVGGFGEVVRDAAAASLSDAKRPDDVWVALRVLQGLGGQARALGASIRPRLADREPMLRVQAARTLAAIGDRAAVPVLIDRLEQEDDRRRHAVVDALERLTKQSFGMLVGSWRAWWAAEGEVFLRNGPPKQPAKKPNPAAATPATTSAYFGIPQDGRAVLYLVDFSQSMRARMSGKQGPTRWQ